VRTKALAVSGKYSRGLFSLTPRRLMLAPAGAAVLDARIRRKAAETSNVLPPSRSKR
jgi:hypothetical protein